jgi:hypothetical protein
MCATDLDPRLDITDLDITGQEHRNRTEGRHPGVAWGHLAERHDGQDDLDGQDVAKPRA